MEITFAQWIPAELLYSQFPHRFIEGFNSLVFIASWDNRRIFAVILGVLFASIAVGLTIASWTRWGQNKVITKCVVLAMLAHIWLLMYAYGTRVVAPNTGDGTAAEGPVRVRLLDHSASLNTAQESNVADEKEPEKPWIQPDRESLGDALVEEMVRDIRDDENELTEALVAQSSLETLIDDLETEFLPPIDSTFTEELNSAVENAQQEATDEYPLTDSRPVETAVAQGRDLLPNSAESTSPGGAPEQNRNPNGTESEDWQDPESLQYSMPSAETTRTVVDQFPQPKANKYLSRISPDRAQLVARYGGDADTEAAVEEALRWLALNQSQDGSWDAARFGAGTEREPLGEFRAHTGRHADTAMTGLALLAFLGAGNTHQSGTYRENVTRGLEFLMREQMPSGDLSGKSLRGDARAIQFARMYSHGMAGLAVAEAYALSRDARLRGTVENAVTYTLSAQNPRTGGWRYSVRIGGDPGDLSQFGWQAMLLSSAQSAGISLAPNTTQRLETFLNLVQSGDAGGLAVYRPVPGQRPTPAMTAEALACRLLLGIRLNETASLEAKRYLLSNLPDSQNENLYYWYYATLAMFQFQDASWNRWNDSLKRQLVSSQISTGAYRGSWEPSGLWAGYGGRVYSTAMAAMCLEVYYRYLPMYQPQLASTGR